MIKLRLEYFIILHSYKKNTITIRLKLRKVKIFVSNAATAQLPSRGPRGVSVNTLLWKCVCVCALFITHFTVDF